MRNMFAVVFVFALGTSLPAASYAADPATADAVKVDPNGKCHDAKGGFVKCPPAQKPAKACKKGKPCGGSCIAMNKVCNKPG